MLLFKLCSVSEFDAAVQMLLMACFDDGAHMHVLPKSLPNPDASRLQQIYDHLKTQATKHHFEVCWQTYTLNYSLTQDQLSYLITELTGSRKPVIAGARHSSKAEKEAFQKLLLDIFYPSK